MLCERVEGRDAVADDHCCEEHEVERERGRVQGECAGDCAGECVIVY